MKKKVRDLEQMQREQLAEIGSFLKQSREQQSLSLEELASRTLIRRSLLAAIESADLEQLPEPIYIRGLIKLYATKLGLDGEMVASQFVLHPHLRKAGLSWQTSAAAQLRPFHLYAVYVLIMIAAVSGLSYVLQRNTPEAATLPALDPLNQLEEAQQSPAGNASQPEGAASAESPTTTEALPAEGIQVKVVLISQSWMRVVVDGETQFEGIMKEGESQQWQADEQLTVRAGNAGGVLVAHNGKEAEKLGEPGMVAEVTFSQEEQISLNSTAILP
ncbi:MAG: helix-turn-helix domain-containing protein [Leptolyngbya sp. SIO4C5]|nr:helix-turn-helix domain-containing protein [Leptolyngbya sp. SIO4C5]